MVFFLLYFESLLKLIEKYPYWTPALQVFFTNLDMDKWY